jgi:hypothetical protein
MMKHGRQHLHDTQKLSLRIQVQLFGFSLFSIYQTDVTSFNQFLKLFPFGFFFINLVRVRVRVRVREGLGVVT